MDGCFDGCINVSVDLSKYLWIDGCIDEWVMNGWVRVPMDDGCMYGPMDRCMHGYLMGDGWINRWKNA